MMMVFEHESLEAAESLVSDSRYLMADLEKAHRPYEYIGEIG